MDTLKIPDSYLYKTGERIIPGSVTDDALHEHCARYLFASKHCKNKKVLNVSSGSGYGSAILLNNAKEVFNVDLSEYSIAYGNKIYGSFNNHFLTMDAQALNFPNEFFDVVVSFETIEHLNKPVAFINECARVLKKNGKFILSTPNKAITSPETSKPRNKFHVHEWTITQMKKLVKERFKLSELFGQRFIGQNVLPSQTEKFFFSLLGICMKFTPGVIFKFIKENILRYKKEDILKLKIDKENQLFRANEVEFFPGQNKKAYSIMLLVLTKK